MIETFTRDGVSFKYPGNWTLEVDAEADGDWVATLQTPATALFMATYRRDADPAELADETLDALTADYPDLESTPTAEKLAGRLALGHDIGFITLDVPVSVRLRVLDLGEATLLLMIQMADQDEDHYSSLMGAILASVTLLSP
jgi:hypothetical protein